MRWLERDNTIQFAYADLLAGTPATWKHFYTSSLSVKTAHLVENPFHESFPRAALEDIELGYRLARQGALDLHFLPEAVADHLHPTDFAGSCRRMAHVGQAGFLLGQLWPDFRRSPPRTAWKRLPLAFAMRQPWLLRLLTRLTVPVTRVVCFGPWLHTLLMLHERAGYEAAERAAQHGPPASLAAGQRVR